MKYAPLRMRSKKKNTGNNTPVFLLSALFIFLLRFHYQSGLRLTGHMPRFFLYLFVSNIVLQYIALTIILPDKISRGFTGTPSAFCTCLC